MSNRHLGAWLMVACVAVALFAADRASGEVAARFEGCEAEDVRAIIFDRDPVWTGKKRTLGDWNVRNRINVRCNAKSCVAHSSLEVGYQGVLLAQSDYASDPLQAVHPTLRTGRIVLAEAEKASSLAEAIGAAGHVQEGALRRTFMDYGEIAGQIKLRVRTEISCAPDTNQCVVRSAPIIFMPYDQRSVCGSFAAPARSEGLGIGPRQRHGTQSSLPVIGG